MKFTYTILFLLVLLFGCAEKKKVDQFLIKNGNKVKILSVQGARHGYVLIVEGVKTKERVAVYGNYEKYAPLVNDLILIDTIYHRDDKVYDVVGPAGEE